MLPLTNIKCRSNFESDLFFHGPVILPYLLNFNLMDG